MKIELKRGDELAVIEADDDLLQSSFPYSGIFERQVKVVTSGFYKDQTQEAPHGEREG